VEFLRVQAGGTGLQNQVPLEALIRIEAATDLMEQVQRFLDDKSVHPAAPIVLAGAALEELLRSMLNPGQPVDGKPGLNTYATALRKQDRITAADAKES
jgi:hypothetical protein